MGKSLYHIHDALIAKCKKGNTKAQMKLYGLYADAMFNVSVRILADDAEAEDAVQESFISAFEKLETYKGEVAFGAWLKRIVVNKSLDALRKRKIEFTELSDNVEGNLVETAEVKIDTAENWELIKRAVEELPEKYRLIFSLHVLEGYDHEEISEVLNISYSLSRTQFHRAKEKLKEIVRVKLKEEVYG